jgi:nucleoside permease NupC
MIPPILAQIAEGIHFIFDSLADKLAAFATAFLIQMNIADFHALVNGLAHIVDG